MKEKSSAYRVSSGDKVIDGNATVERNLYVDGNASVDGKIEVTGNAHISKSLKVDGFLDAPNVRGCSKGVFTSYDSLVSAYSRPHVGWWAVVCARLSSGSSEGTSYMCELDEYERPIWQDTGATVSLAGLVDQFEGFQASVDELSSEVSSLGDSVAGLSSELSATASSTCRR